MAPLERLRREHAARSRSAEAPAVHHTGPAHRLGSSPPATLTRPPVDPVLVHRAHQQGAADRARQGGFGPMAAWSAFDVDFAMVAYAAGESSTSDGLTRHGGREFGLLLSGVLTVRVDDEEHVLEAGDSITFDATLPHRLHNRGAGEARAMWLTFGHDDNWAARSARQ